jgi:hypothetical protein
MTYLFGVTALGLSIFHYREGVVEQRSLMSWWTEGRQGEYRKGLSKIQVPSITSSALLSSMSHHLILFTIFKECDHVMNPSRNPSIH